MRQSSARKEKSESACAAKSTRLFGGFPRARYDRDAALKVMPLSAIFVVMIVSNQFTLKYVEVSFYNVARCEIRSGAAGLSSLMVSGSVFSVWLS